MLQAEQRARCRLRVRKGIRAPGTERRQDGCEGDQPQRGHGEPRSSSRQFSDRFFRFWKIALAASGRRGGGMKKRRHRKSAWGN